MENNTTPLVSVMMPSKNAQEFLSITLDSLLAQTYTNWELIFVNDGSKDNTLHVLENLAIKDNRIKVINQENQGLSGARNTGIENAKGDYIMFVDADDWLEPNAFELISKNFNKEDLFCFSYNRVFEKKIVPRNLKINGIYEAAFIQRRMVGLIGEELRDPSQADSLVTAWGKIYKTEIIKKNEISFLDTKMIGTEDALFNKRPEQLSVQEFINLTNSVEKALKTMDYRFFSAFSLSKKKKI